MHPRFPCVRGFQRLVVDFQLFLDLSQRSVAAVESRSERQAPHSWAAPKQSWADRSVQACHDVNAGAPFHGGNNPRPAEQTYTGGGVEEAKGRRQRPLQRARG